MTRWFRRNGLDLRGHDWEPGPNGPLHFTTCWCRPERACRCDPTGDRHSAFCRAGRR